MVEKSPTAIVHSQRRQSNDASALAMELASLGMRVHVLRRG